MGSAYAILRERRKARGIKRSTILSNQVLGTLIFICTELMFFTALMSAYLVIRAGSGNWVPPEGVRLPVMATAFNSIILILSGVLTVYVGQQYKKTGALNKNLYGLAIIFASFFLIFQGFEWYRLITHGMTFTSDIFGATFYLVIGCHALHALGGVGALIYGLLQSKNGELSLSTYHAITLFWLFIVGVWPVIYRLVYFV